MRKLFLLMLSMLLLAMPTMAQDDDLTELPFFLTFIPNIQFAPIYVLDMQLQESFDYVLNIEYGDENVGLDLIANGNIPFGIISGEQVVMARAAGRPVVYVFEWFQQFPVGIIIPDTTNAQTVEDLRGLRVGLPGRFGANYAGLTAILSVNGMTEDDVQLEAIGFAAPDVICVGRVDAAVVYVNNEPLQVQLRADRGECGDITSVTVLPVSDYGDIVSNGLVTSETLITNDSGLVYTMVSSFYVAVKAVIDNPAQAYLDSMAYVENLPMTDDFRAVLEEAALQQADFLAGFPSREEIADSRADLAERLRAEFDAELLTQFEVLLATIPLWDAEWLGYSDPASWEFTRDLMADMGNLIAPLDDLTGAFSNDFLPDVEIESEEES